MIDVEYGEGAKELVHDAPQSVRFGIGCVRVSWAMVRAMDDECLAVDMF